MRVALVCPYDLSRPGGVQQQVMELARRLSKSDEVWVVGPGLAEGEAGVEVRSVGSAVVVPGNRSAVPVALHPGAWRRVRRAVADADVVHIHEPLQPVVSVAAVSADVPRVATFHADPAPWARTLYRVGSPLVGRWLDEAVRTAVSEVAAGSLPPRWRPVRVVPNGLDVAAYRTDEARRAHRVAFLGRDDPRKGLDVLLEAWPRIRERVPAAELVVIGARRPNAPAGVEYLGRVPREEKIDALASSAVFVAPNLGGESFGVVLAEGMAAGCAVVASDLPAFRWVVGDAGRLVQPGDPAALAEAVVALLADDQERERMAARARRQVGRFDWSEVAARYRDLYTEAMGGGGSGAT